MREAPCLCPLSGVKLVIPALFLQKLVVGAALDDPSLFQNHDAVRVFDGGKTVGDHESGAALHQPVHALLNQRLGAGVDGGGGLVQNQHRGIGHGGPCNGKKLPLALA